jgi:hypothetical protein
VYATPWALWDCSMLGFGSLGLARLPKARTAFGPARLAALTLNYRGRIMTYVLIVVSWLGGTVNGAGVSTQEFSSVERCEAARIALVTDAKARALEDQLRPICLQK